MTHYRIPIGGWRKSVHESAAFDSRGEYCVAGILDEAASVVWWFRNDPPVLRIPTPLTYLEPDFVYLAERKRKRTYGALEVKGGIFWNGEDSDAQIKARSACQWTRAVNEAGPEIPWEFAVVLDQDAESAKSLEELHRAAVTIYPPIAKP